MALAMVLYGGVVHITHHGIGSAMLRQFRTIRSMPRRLRLVAGNLAAIF